MAFREYKAVYFRAGDTVGVEMDNVISIRVTRTLNAKSNSTEILLDNQNSTAVEDGEIIYKPDETIKVYGANGTIQTSNNAHLIGVYTILNHEIDPKAKVVKLNCGDKTYLMLSRVFIGDEIGTVDAIVNTIVQRTNQTGAGAAEITTDIDSVRSDSSAFPTIEFTSVKKNAYECISELSQTNYTLDNRAYMFWFDENGKFFWKYTGQTPVGTLTDTADPIVEMKISKTESQKLSMLIYDAGEDKNGSSIIDFYLKPDAGSITGRIKYHPMIAIAKDLKRRYIAAGTYAAMSNNTFIENVTLEARAKAQAIVDKVGIGLWEVNAVSVGQKYDMGDLYQVSSPLQGFPATNLRLDRVVHRMDRDGWTTLLTLTEDPEAEEI